MAKRNRYQRIAASAVALSVGALFGCSAPSSLTVTATTPNASPLSGAQLEVLGEGLVQSFDSSGKVQLSTLRYHGWKGIKISATGYETMFRQIDFVPGHTAELDVQLRPAPAAHHVTLSASAPVAVDEGIATVTIAPGGLVHKDGSTVTGDVDVLIVPFDPVSRDAPPASMQTIDGRRLISLGMSTITITQNGEELQPKSGAPLAWAMDVNPALMPMTDPSKYRLFSVNEKYGTWQPEPTATLAYDAGTHRFTAQLPHLSVWNCDMAFVAGACVTGQVFDAHHQIVTSGNVSAVDLSVGQSVDGVSAAYQAQSSLGVRSPQYLGNLFTGTDNGYDDTGLPDNYYYDGGAPTAYPVSIPSGGYFIPVPVLDSSYQNLAQDYGLEELPMQITLSGVTLSNQQLYAVTKNGSPLATTLTQGPLTPPEWACDAINFQYCFTDGTACASGDQCCNGQSCGSDGKCGSSTCKNTGDVCASTSDCCNGESCVNGLCGVVNQCASSGGACSNVTDCCANAKFCLHNVCATCLPTSATGCSTNGDCCTGTCVSGVCQNCQDQGAACTSSGQCCNGASCLSGVCEQCAGQGGSCSTTADCCGGFCLDNSCAACVPVEHACVSGQPCCGGATCAFDNKCRVCSAQGASCTTGIDCCSGQCSDNFCL